MLSLCSLSTNLHTHSCTDCMYLAIVCPGLYWSWHYCEGARGEGIKKDYFWCYCTHAVDSSIPYVYFVNAPCVRIFVILFLWSHFLQISQWFFVHKVSAPGWLNNIEWFFWFAGMIEDWGTLLRAYRSTCSTHVCSCIHGHPVSSASRAYTSIPGKHECIPR